MLQEPRYHPVSEIAGVKGEVLKGKAVIFGLTASAAIYRSVDVMRELIRRGAKVYPLMTEEAASLISPTLIEWATGSKTYVRFAGGVGHVALGREASSMAIAPATANTICRLAAGVAEDAVTLTALEVMGLGKPLVLVPAMHYGMWVSPQVRDAVTRLRRWGVTILGPEVAEGKAKYPPIDEVVSAVESVTLRGKDLRGFRVLVTAGPTREWLDRVRFLTNPSSGRMGVEIARDACFRGAEVTLVHGPLTVPEPVCVRRIAVETTEGMLSVVLKEVRSTRYDAVVLAAAPLDFKFASRFEGKIRSGRPVNVRLEPLPKISLALKREFKGLLVGFAAECVDGDYGELERRARAKLEERGFDIIVANDVCREGVGFGSEYNEVLILEREGSVTRVSTTLKSEVGRRVLDVVRDALTKQHRG